jgi:Lysylphosphatidylglycerol synthase TM region
MKTFRRAVIVVGIVAISVLLWKLDARVVMRIVSRVGVGIFLILALEVVTITLNAVGWRLCFNAAEAPAYRVSELWKLWLAMEGINYLIPTGTIAGEVARASMLNDSHPVEVRTASVVISRFGPQLAQITFILTGFVLLVSRLRWFGRHPWMRIAATSLLAAITVLALVYALGGYRWIASREMGPPDSSGLLRSMSRALRRYFGRHPWRFLASVCVFGAAYTWPAVEVWWICRFIGVPVSAVMALTIEVMSNAIDGALFIVPAKIGTQELGKTAIFSILGLPLSSGLAFGIIRHIRELVWALVGFSIYSTWRRRSIAT